MKRRPVVGTLVVDGTRVEIRSRTVARALRQRDTQVRTLELQVSQLKLEVEVLRARRDRCEREHPPLDPIAEPAAACEWIAPVVRA